jgi:hypothetical protein
MLLLANDYENGCPEAERSDAPGTLTMTNEPEPVIWSASLLILKSFDIIGNA